MHGGITVTEKDVGDIEPANQLLFDLIRRLDNPAHILSGRFKTGDDLNTIDEKLSKAESDIMEAKVRLREMRNAVDTVKAKGNS